MGIKDKVKRASKIFSSDSKESLPKEIEALKDDTTATDAPEAEVAAETKTEAVAEVDAPVAEVEAPVADAEAEVEAEVEPTVEDVAEVKKDEIVDAEPATEEAAAEVAEESEPKTEEAKTESAAAGVAKAVKKNDIFKRILNKFKKSTSSSTKTN